MATTTSETAPIMRYAFAIAIAAAALLLVILIAQYLFNIAWLDQIGLLARATVVVAIAGILYLRYIEGVPFPTRDQD